VSSGFRDNYERHQASVRNVRFCHHIHFFAAREEAERWAARRNDIAILSLDEGFELGRQVWSRMLADVA